MSIPLYSYEFALLDFIGFSLGGDRRGVSNLGDLLLRLLHHGLLCHSLLRRHFPRSLHRRFLCSGLLRSTLLRQAWLRRSFSGMERRPALLCGSCNRPPASGAMFPRTLRYFGRGDWLRRALRLSPAFPLCVTDTFPGSGAQLSTFAFWNLRRSDWLRATTGQHGPEFGNLSVDTELLL